jgi:hypothetical protein
MMRPLSPLEVITAKISAGAMTLWYCSGLPPLTLPAWFVAYISFYCISNHVLGVFLVVIKNGGGWPDD